jgi:hypothetical protein
MRSLGLCELAKKLPKILKNGSDWWYENLIIRKHAGGSLGLWSDG